MAFVKNKTNRLATAPGLDFIFEPGEVKEIKNPKQLEFIRKCPDIFEIYETPKSKKEYICEICGYVAKTASGLRLHKRKHKK